MPKKHFQTFEIDSSEAGAVDDETAQRRGANIAKLIACKSPLTNEHNTNLKLDLAIEVHDAKPKISPANLATAAVPIACSAAMTGRARRIRQRRCGCLSVNNEWHGETKSDDALDRSSVRRFAAAFA